MLEEAWQVRLGPRGVQRLDGKEEGVVEVRVVDGNEGEAVKADGV